MAAPGFRIPILAGVLALAAGCGGPSVESSSSVSGDQSAGAAPSAGPVIAWTLTLAEDGCTSTDAAAVQPGGSFSIEAVNTTASDAGFDLYRLHPDVSYQDWVVFHESVQESLDTGVDGGQDPNDLADPIDLQVAVASGETGVLTADSATAGSYVLQCWIFPESGVTKVATAGPFEIGRESS